jgi:phospholipase/carboxylesterase
MRERITRRHFGATIGGALASFALDGACRRASEPRQADDGRLTARPRANIQPSARGERALGLDSRRDAILHLPPTPGRDPYPLLVLFHGAGQNPESVLRHLGAASDEVGVAVLAPYSRDSSWDAIRGTFGRDVSFVNRCLEVVFDSVAVDPARIAVGGFSDGATYALSLGLINGDLFRRVVAFSPGFVVDGAPHGRPSFFISHGTDDPILPIDRCSRLIAAGLQKRGYDVTLREFDGGHEIPAQIAHDGIEWVAATPAAEDQK